MANITICVKIYMDIYPSFPLVCIVNLKLLKKNVKNQILGKSKASDLDIGTECMISLHELRSFLAHIQNET